MQYMFSESWKENKILSRNELGNIFLHFSWHPIGTLKQTRFWNISELYSYNDVLGAFKILDNYKRLIEVPNLRNDFDWLNYSGNSEEYIEHCKKPQGERTVAISFTERAKVYYLKYCDYYDDLEISSMIGIHKKFMYTSNIYKYETTDKKYVSIKKIPKIEPFDQRRYDKNAVINYLNKYVKAKL